MSHKKETATAIEFIEDKSGEAHHRAVVKGDVNNMAKLHTNFYVALGGAGKAALNFLGRERKPLENSEAEIATRRRKYAMWKKSGKPPRNLFLYCNKQEMCFHPPLKLNLFRLADVAEDTLLEFWQVDGNKRKEFRINKFKLESCEILSEHRVKGVIDDFNEAFSIGLSLFKKASGSYDVWVFNGEPGSVKGAVRRQLKRDLSTVYKELSEGLRASNETSLKSSLQVNGFTAGLPLVATDYCPASENSEIKLPNFFIEDNVPNLKMLRHQARKFFSKKFGELLDWLSLKMPAFTTLKGSLAYSSALLLITSVMGQPLVDTFVGTIVTGYYNESKLNEAVVATEMPPIQPGKTAEVKEPQRSRPPKPKPAKLSERPTEVEEAAGEMQHFDIGMRDTISSGAASSADKQKRELEQLPASPSAASETPLADSPEGGLPDTLRKPSGIPEGCESKALGSPCSE